MTPAPALPAPRRSRLRLGLAGVGVLGTADVAQFLATNGAMVANAPGRAAGSVLGILVWAGVTGCALGSVRRPGSARLDRALLALSAAAALGGVGLTAIHAAAHVGGLRPASTGVLGLAAFGLAAAATRAERPGGG